MSEQMQIVNLIVQIVAVVFYAATLITTIVISMRQNKNANEIALTQSRNDFYAEYTRRYQDIILAMPDAVFEGTAKAEGATLKYMQLYFDLCSEEYHLHQNGLVPDNVWDNWKEGWKSPPILSCIKRHGIESKALTIQISIALWRGMC